MWNAILSLKYSGKCSYMDRNLASSSTQLPMLSYKINMVKILYNNAYLSSWQENQQGCIGI